MKTVLHIVIVLISLNGIAQKSSREKVRTYKIAYLTEQLNLSSKEAQSFWPVYNEHERKLEQLKQDERKIIRSLKEMHRNSEKLSEAQADDFLNKIIQIEEQKGLTKKNMLTELRKVIPSTKVMKLIKAEADFHKRLLNRIKERRMNRPRPQR